MNSVICTLYEGNYHHGVAALVNSLYKNGFRGAIYVGYRGETLPPWAGEAKNNPDLEWKNASTLIVTEGIELHFLPLNTNYHLANYKPNFMLQLWSGPAKNSDGMFYFDPDIVVRTQWSYYENWINHGVALVHEILSNDMPPTHPLRKDWEKVAVKMDRVVTNNLNSYINSGFCGLRKKNISFLFDWEQIIQTGIKHFGFIPEQFQHFKGGRGFLFFAFDQDAFNIAAMTANVPLSEMGPEAMDFVYGGFTMSHATGSPKPWLKSYLISALKGKPPTLADKAFWNYVGSPIDSLGWGVIKFKMLSMKVASFVGRFYRKY